MMHVLRTIRDIFIVGLSLSGTAALYRSYMRRSGPLVRVIVFHDVEDRMWFESVIGTIAQKYRILTPKEFSDKESDTERVNILVTFDDGYASWTDVALPVLERFGIKALFFVNSGLIDVYGDQEATASFLKERLLLSSSRKTLSWDGVRKIVNEGHTIGGHTRGHVRLSKNDEREQRAEVEGDKKRIESQIGCPIRDFAYPFGGRSDYTEVTEGIIKNAGYRHAFSTKASFFRNDQEVPRLCIEDNLSSFMIMLWIEGSYDLYKKLVFWK